MAEINGVGNSPYNKGKSCAYNRFSLSFRYTTKIKGMMVGPCFYQCLSASLYIFFVKILTQLHIQIMRIPILHNILRSTVINSKSINISLESVNFLVFLDLLEEHKKKKKCTYDDFSRIVYFLIGLPW